MKSKQRSTVDKVLTSFSDYMTRNDDTVEQWAANCDNEGWNDLMKQHSHKGQKVADVMRCRLMNTALWFANKDDEDDEEVNRLRCEVVNVFGNILKRRYCPQQGGRRRGIEYAWEIMRQMGNTEWGGVVPQGPVTKHECTECGYKGSWTDPGVVNGDMATWLLLQWRVMDKITHMERTMECTADWKTYQLEQGKDGNLAAPAADGKKKLEDVKEEAKKIAEDIVKKMHENVKKVLDDLGNCKESRDKDCVQQLFEKEVQEPAGKKTITNKWPTRNIQPNTNTNSTAADQEHKDQDKGSSTSSDTASGKPVQESVGTTDTTPAGGASVGRHDPTTSETTPTTVTPTPAPPAAPAGGDSSGKDQSSGGTSTDQVADNKGKCTKGPQVFKETNTGMGIFGATSTTTISIASGAGADDDCDQQPTDTGKGSVLSEYPQQKPKKKKQQQFPER
ncbi:hypothetical protein AK88_05629 [Plasmodium fragile]|uniref:Schizont-infected cell agglutination extracellular alpha domain-containing protein n=1 Tax=Plasmodium fragile TaxID=5857 RepID=A0A0D9QCN2_PLAFR|nr:uncharacterized protein AK88_05629 [Plasmodium fragile]KJP84739.1 hypothetical protein AK88_05629 [Plasmodium fragile]